MNNNIKFLRYSADGIFKEACKQHKNPLELEISYSAEYQMTSSSCCKQDTIIFSLLPVELQIKPTVLSLCSECASRLPLTLEVINLSSNGASPALVDKIYSSEV